MIRDDARIEAERTLRLRDFVAREAAIGPDAFTDELDELDAQMPYNCEHVVPQSSFAKKEPMRGDLHHLFTCESRCNSFRSNTPYYEFNDDRAVMHDCGRSEPGEAGRFEPRAGKGAVARATMYFLLRYPGMIGDESRELQAERLPILLGVARGGTDWRMGASSQRCDRRDPRQPKPAHRQPAVGEPNPVPNSVRQTRLTERSASVLQQVAHYHGLITQQAQVVEIFCAGDDFGIALIAS